MPLPTLAATITPAGISAPSYEEILQSMRESVQGIYGADAYIAPDSQDGQFLTLIATAINDSNQMAISIYQSFSPTFAQGAGLSSVVKINGLTRALPTFSTAPGTATGTAGATITGGVVVDNNGQLWDLPSPTVIGGGGTVNVTVTAQDPGAIVAPSGSINRINNPQLGWQSFTSTSDATPGNPVETDAALRQRQTESTSLPATGPTAAILANLANLFGVTRVAIYENDTASPDSNGVPAHSIAVVIEGGDPVDIAEIIGQTKAPGASTFGDVSENYTDPLTLIVYAINFDVLAEQAVSVAISVDVTDAWNTTVEAAIQQAVADYINSLGIGVDVDYTRLWLPAYLNGSPDGRLYEITVLQLDGGVVDTVIAYNKAPSCDPSNVVITVNP